MNLKAVFTGVLFFLSGLYYIGKGIYLYKNRDRIIFSYISIFEEVCLFWVMLKMIDYSLMLKYSINYKGLIIGTLFVIIYFCYIIYSRMNDIKYRIYNAEKNDYKKAIKNTLDEYQMEFSLEDEYVEIKGAKQFIEFIAGGFLIKHCKKMDNYRAFLSKLDYNLKYADIAKKKRDWLGSIIIGIVLIGLSIL